MIVYVHFFLMTDNTMFTFIENGEREYFAANQQDNEKIVDTSSND